MKDNRHRSPRNFDHNDNSPNSENFSKKDQDHRNKMQERYLSTFRLGQFFGFIYNLALLYLVYDLVISGEKTLALQIFALNAAILAFVILAFLIEKKLSFRRFSRNRNNNRKFDNRRKVR